MKVQLRQLAVVSPNCRGYYYGLDFLSIACGMCHHTKSLRSKCAWPFECSVFSTIYQLSFQLSIVNWPAIVCFLVFFDFRQSVMQMLSLFASILRADGL